MGEKPKFFNADDASLTLEVSLIPNSELSDEPKSSFNSIIIRLAVLGPIPGNEVNNLTSPDINLFLNSSVIFVFYHNGSEMVIFQASEFIFTRILFYGF